jgi:hypothetical protein
MVEAYSRRRLLGALAVASGGAGLAACTATRQNSPFWSTVTSYRPGVQSDEVIRAYAANLPYSSMLFWFDGQSLALTVLSRIEPDQRLVWYTAEKTAITTFGPFIVATAGTDVELRGTEFGSGWSTDVRTLVGKTLSRQTRSVQRGVEATATLVSRFRDAGMTQVEILSVKKPARRIDETVIAENRVRLLNSYWIDPVTGDNLKSRQQVIPTMAPVNTAVLRRANG